MYPTPNYPSPISRLACRTSRRRGDLRRQRLIAKRRGIAAVELAICLPLMVIFTFASIEMCSAIYLRQTLTIAAYEGARVACHPQGMTADAREAAQRILTERNVNGGSIAINPSNFDGVAKGTVIQVSVTAPVGANSLLRFGVFGTSQLTGECSMRKE